MMNYIIAYTTGQIVTSLIWFLAFVCLKDTIFNKKGD